MLTKSDFLIYLDSPLHLWAFKHNQYFKELSEYDKHLAKQGYEVEALARQYVEQQISKDAEYQKIFQTEQLYSKSDICITNSDGTYDIYEVKSVTDLKKEHEYDLLFQYYTATNSVNNKIKNIYAIYLNKEYTRGDTLSLEELFIVKNMTTYCTENLKRIEGEIEEALLTSQKESSNSINGCYKPKDCPCKELCFPYLPEYSIYDLTHISESKVNILKDLNVSRIIDIPESMKLTEKQKVQVKATKENRVIFSQECILNDLDGLQYPIYFLDYETYSWAVPKYLSHKTYQDVVFQFSIHKRDSKDGELHHFEYLATTRDDPMYEIIKQLERVIGSVGSILVWNKSFEMGCNSEMARIYPAYEDFLLNLNRRIYDLGDIFSKDMYVDYHFKGSWSIKNVLPVLVPELSYKNMEICNGTEAMSSWEQITYGDLPEEERCKTIKELLEYCKLDTFAMVKIYDFLTKLLSPEKH